MLSIMWIFRRRNPHKVFRGFRMAQTVSAAALALGHGLQDAQKTMGVIFLALITAGYYSPPDTDEPPAVGRSSSSAARDLARHLLRWLADHAHPGPQDHPPRPGPRLRRRVGRRDRALHDGVRLPGPDLDHPHITSAIMGAGATKRFSAVRWGVARSIVTAWVLTFPMAGLAAALFYVVLHASSAA